MTTCKLCEDTRLVQLSHTARCRGCGALLYYPYPDRLPERNDPVKSRQGALSWYGRSAWRNHRNFTNMLRFALPESLAHEPLSILDYGGGGGQFALVARSHFPQATVYITDINDHGLLDEWRPLNVQIPFGEFPRNSTRFDAIFLNDVFEHVADPVGVLRLLASKLKPDGRIFIDTPKVFWLYPVTRWLAPGLHAKLLKGTVSLNHLQIWSRRSFHHAVEKSGLRITKYAETSEYTMGADYYLSKRMGIQNSTVRCMGHLFFRVARWVAKNKIIAVLAH